MSLEESRVRDVVDTYVRLVGERRTGAAADITALYADGATVEDPIGSDVLTTPEQIQAFYATLEDLDQTTAVRWTRVVGNEVLFEFEILTRAGEKTYRLAPIDHMVLDDEGRITAMRAFWGPGDMSEA